MALSAIYDLDKAATALHITKRQLLAHVAAGNIRFIDFGTGKHRVIRFSEGMLEEFIAKMSRLNSPTPVVIRTPSTTPKPTNDTRLSLKERLRTSQAEKGA
jgi:hypothetical protein